MPVAPHDRDHPSYEGRPLAKPDEEVVDQGLPFDVTTLMGRRQMLLALGLSGGALALAGCGSSAGASSAPSSTSPATGATTAAGLAEIPDETAGPYPADGSNGPDVLEESGIVRDDIRASFGGPTGVADGVPLTITLALQDMTDGHAPFVGAAVYLWHCDREGRYSMYSEGVESENYLRGVQVADVDGSVTFTSVFPACYTGRWPHVHFEVYPDLASTADSADAVATSQLALPADVCDAVYAEPGYESSVATRAQVSLESDNVFGDDGGASQLGTVTGDVAGGYAVTLVVPVDPTTVPATGGGGAGGPGGPPGALPNG
ncbi:intradiol ring-cleavage dioxygenase [Jannaschia sp. R86511]|uniref:intradiol ring-cleavage dioxygenase n=1 Tax=Jannaschia sp. R86511 TaxID=3093853 RepID=UPI0036D22692